MPRFLLHDDGMEEGGAGEPGHEGGVFDGVPSPVAAPAEDGVGPVHAEADAAGEEEPGDHGPAAGDADPLFAGVAHHEGAEGEGEGDGEADVAEVEHRRVDDHLGVLEEGVEAVAVRDKGAGLDGEGWGGEVEEGEEEDLDAGEDGGGVSEEAGVDLVAQAEDEAVAAEEKGPEEEGAFLAGPEGGELVGGGEGAVGVVKDVLDGEVVGERRPDKGEGGAEDGDEAADASTAGGFSEAEGTGVGVGREGLLSPKGEGSAEEGIGAEDEGK